MKIRSIEAFAIRSDLVGGPATTVARRPVWTADAEVANPMSGYPVWKQQFLVSCLNSITGPFHSAAQLPTSGFTFN